MPFVCCYSRPKGGGHTVMEFATTWRGKVEEEEGRWRRKGGGGWNLVNLSARKLLPYVFSCARTKHSDWKRRLTGGHWNTKMGCCFSKKSKRKSPEKEDHTATTTTLETTTTSNAVPLGNDTDEAPKQYSWDKREKVTCWTEKKPQIINP